MLDAGTVLSVTILALILVCAALAAAALCAALAAVGLLEMLVRGQNAETHQN